MVTAIIRASVLSGGNSSAAFVFFFLSGFLTADTGKGFSLQFLPQYKGRRRYSRSGEGSSKIRLKGGLDEGRELGLLRLQIPLRFNHSRGWPEKRAS